MTPSGWALLSSVYPGQATVVVMSTLHLALSSLAQVLLQLMAI